MALRSSRPLAVAAAVLACAVAGCERGLDGLGIAPVDTDPVVFTDEFGNGVIFQPFLDTKIDALTTDLEQRWEGSRSLRVTVPAPWDDTGLYAGGAMTCARVRDFSGYNALTFWAKATQAVTLNSAGLGNDNTGTSRFTASRSGIPLGQTWAKVIVPIPLPAKLTAEQGLFFFAEGAENGQGFTMWFDEIRYEYLDEVTNPRPTLLPATVYGYVGQDLALGGTRTTFNVGGVDQTVEHSPEYFTYATSDSTVAVVEGTEIRIVGVGQAFVTAMLGDVAAGGRVTLNTALPPVDAAPVPTDPAEAVISLFSDAYANRPVDAWSTTWDNANVTDYVIAGDSIKVYTGLSTTRFAAIEFTSPTIDASAMGFLHLDIWAPDGFFVKLKLVDFGANGVFDGGDDTQSTERGFLITPGEWTSLDIPMTEFTGHGLAATAHLAQLVILGNPTLLFLDNLYFHE